MFIEKCIKLDCRRRKKYAKLKVLFPLLKILSTNSVYSKKKTWRRGQKEKSLRILCKNGLEVVIDTRACL